MLKQGWILFKEGWILDLNGEGLRTRFGTGASVFSEVVNLYSLLKSEGGLFVDMDSFLAFGKDYVGWNYEKTGNPVYLHIKETLKPVSKDRPPKKPTLLAIGMEGGFDNNNPEYEESYEIVILPEYVTLPFPSVELPEKVRLAVEAVIMNTGAEKKRANCCVDC